jgi:hypothetical protein
MTLSAYFLAVESFRAPAEMVGDSQLDVDEVPDADLIEHFDGAVSSFISGMTSSGYAPAQSLESEKVRATIIRGGIQYYKLSQRVKQATMGLNDDDEDGPIYDALDSGIFSEYLRETFSTKPNSKAEECLQSFQEEFVHTNRSTFSAVLQEYFSGIDPDEKAVVNPVAVVYDRLTDLQKLMTMAHGLY